MVFFENEPASVRQWVSIIGDFLLYYGFSFFCGVAGGEGRTKLEKVGSVLGGEVLGVVREVGDQLSSPLASGYYA